MKETSACQRCSREGESRIRLSPRDEDLILRLADGTHAAIAMIWTDSGEGQALSATQSGLDLPRLDLQGLRQILQFFDQLRQEDRFPTPRRSPRRSRPARRKLPPGNN